MKKKRKQSQYVPEYENETKRKCNIMLETTSGYFTLARIFILSKLTTGTVGYFLNIVYQLSVNICQRFGSNFALKMLYFCLNVAAHSFIDNLYTGLKTCI